LTSAIREHINTETHKRNQASRLNPKSKLRKAEHATKINTSSGNQTRASPISFQLDQRKQTPTTPSKKRRKPNKQTSDMSFEDVRRDHPLSKLVMIPGYSIQGGPSAAQCFNCPHKPSFNTPQALEHHLSSHEHKTYEAAISSFPVNPPRTSVETTGNDFSSNVSCEPRYSGAPTFDNRVILSPTSVKQKQLRQTANAKFAIRRAVVHLLAIQPLSLQWLRARLPGTSETDIKEALSTVAEQAKEPGMWKLQLLAWKELDVWNYKYNSAEDRTKARKNAEYHYDKLQLSYEGPEWSRLKELRRDGGNGLSKAPARVTSGLMSLPIQQGDIRGNQGPASQKNTPTKLSTSHQSSNQSPANPVFAMTDRQVSNNLFSELYIPPIVSIRMRQCHNSIFIPKSIANTLI
jgi:hypothetical protein